MEAPVRILGASVLSRRVFLHRTASLSLRTAAVSHPPRIISLRQPTPNPRPSTFFPLSLSSSYHSNPNTLSSSPDGSYTFNPSSQNANLGWHRAPFSVDSSNPVLSGYRRDCAITVVLLGWLGARQKHLSRHIKWYNSRGFNAVTFVVGVRELLCFDLGVRVENRIKVLTEELVSWVSGREDDGRERGLIFHTFSNTGWLV